LKRECVVLVEAAVKKGCRRVKACEVLGVNIRTFQRWKNGTSEDRRTGPKTSPANKLTEEEQANVLKIATSKEYRDLSPAQIVPLLADQGDYVASESTLYRLLHQKDMVKHRSACEPTQHHKPKAITATGPNQVWSWDITYLLNVVQGRFYYLYMVEDVYSRKIVGWGIFEKESSEDASIVIEEACKKEGISRDQLTIHSDNGSPMKGAMLLATLERLGVARSFSRPGISDDNPYIESLFRTLKYRPEFPKKPFESMAAAQAWVLQFVVWYNNEHLHSGIRFTTPSQRHQKQDVGILKNREKVYWHAKERNPMRWTREIRNWNPIGPVTLNPEKKEKEENEDLRLVA